MKKLSREARDLIDEVGDADGPGAASRHRVHDGLRRALAGAALTGTLGAATTVQATATAGALAAVGKSAALAVVGWVAVGAGVGVSFIATANYVGEARSTSSARHRAPVSSLSAPASSLPSPSMHASAVAEQPLPAPQTSAANEPAGTESPVPTTITIRSEPAPRIPAITGTGFPLPETAARPQAEPSARPDVAAETRLVGTAQRELWAGHPAAALGLLDQHAAEFPRGALWEERQTIRILALCDLGRIDDARALAHQFVAAVPHSPLVPRVNRSCAFLKR
jgi:hypothetical protein